MNTKLELAAAPPVFDVIRQRYTVSRYGNHEAYLHILAIVMDKLGNIFRYHLTKLLGHPDRSNVDKWFSGRTRVSSLYLARLIQLMLFHEAGIDFPRIRRITWGNPVTIHWRNGANHILTLYLAVGGKY